MSDNPEIVTLAPATICIGITAKVRTSTGMRGYDKAQLDATGDFA